jgi:hypothetical protein
MPPPSTAPVVRQPVIQSPYKHAHLLLLSVGQVGRNVAGIQRDERVPLVLESGTVSFRDLAGQSITRRTEDDTSTWRSSEPPWQQSN